MNHAIGLVGKLQQSSCDQAEIEYMVRCSHILHMQNLIVESTDELQIVAVLLVGERFQYTNEVTY